MSGNKPGGKNRAVIYGEGPARPAIEQILREQAEGLSVHTEGRVDSDQDRHVCWSAMHWVLLSDYESLPIALMEAMAYGVVPICLRRHSGVPGLIEDGVTGLWSGIAKVISLLRSGA